MIIFKFVKRDFNYLQQIFKKYIPDTIKIILEDGISTDVKTILIEYPYIDADYRDTFYNDFSKRFKFFNKNSIRLHLFKSEFGNSVKLNSENYEGLINSYCGFITLRDTKVFTIGRSLLNPKALKGVTSGHCILANYKINIKGYEFDIQAFPWMQQDANVSRCAHIAIWCIVRYFSEQYHFYPFKTLYQITNLPIMNTRKSPSIGLTIHQISQILISCNFSPEVYLRRLIDKDCINLESFKSLFDNKETIERLITLLEQKGIIDKGYITSNFNFCTDTLGLDASNEFNNFENDIVNLLKIYLKNQNIFNLLLYTFIESGIPFIGALESHAHAVAVIGHGKLKNLNNYFNYRGILDSFNFIDRLIVSDDNCLPYKNIFKDKFISDNNYFFFNDLTGAIVPFYEKMFLDINFIYFLILPAIEKNILKIEETQFCIIRRVMMTSSNSFKSFIIKKSQDKFYKEIITSSLMPKFIWIAEYSKIDNFIKGLIEYRIIIDASSINYDPDVYINIKVADEIIVNSLSIENNLEKRYKLENQFEPLYINNLREF